LLEIFHRLVRRNDRRTEAEIQADVRQFILSAPFELEMSQVVSLESPVGDRRRIDVEAGSTVIEVKRDLRREKVRREAEDQLAGYVGFRMTQTGLRYVGVLTDGTQWNCYDLVDGHLRQVSEVLLEDATSEMGRLVMWLEGVLATSHDIAPTASNIEQGLGTGSSAYELDRATLATLYDQHRNNPTVQVKRGLWSRLLTSALGTQFEDTDDLFIDHTLLINTSEIIAHAVLGVPIEALTPATLLAGDKFDEAGVYGVVESDFFDWVVEVEGGDTFIRTLAKRLGRFVWSDVEQDVLKILYQSFIASDTRKRLGEYYTPDWLADAVVSEAVVDSLHSRVLDPACGSGTFLFHAIRKYIAAAEAEGYSVRELLDGVTRHVIGMDLHPVAVTLARVTYLLAIGRKRLTDPGRGNIQIPVYLGDSIQWREQSVDLWSAGNLVIHTSDGRESFDSNLSFPDGILDDAARFDQLVNELADRSSHRKLGSPAPSLKALFSRLAIPEQYQQVIETTFRTMCRLHDEGRDHIWGYYVRNLARPLWLSKSGNRVDVIVGNPPWLAFRQMTTDMQDVFRSMSEQRKLWAGAQLAAHQDLSALFVVRACELYLRKGGRFAFVLPNAAIDREHYAGFRTGTYGGQVTFLKVAFNASWDLRRIRPHFFPRAASVVFGTRTEYADQHDDVSPSPAEKGMPEDVQIWTGKLEAINSSWVAASKWLTRKSGKVRHVGQLTKSPYAPLFTQGATFVPRVAFVVSEQASSALGISQGRVAVRSMRSVQEKKPWKSVPDLSGVVETQFVRPFFTGDNVYPFLIGPPMLAVIPCDDSSLLSQESIDLNPGLQQWWAQATQLWDGNRANDQMSLAERLDYQSTFSKQLPVSSLRVVYNQAGMHVCAAKLHNRRAVVTNRLYWASMRSEEEADYVCALLNAPVTTDLTRPMMSYGKDERDIHKHVWELPIPMFDEGNAIQRRIAELGAKAEKLVAQFEINPSIHFSATRRHIRDVLLLTAEGAELNELAFELLG
jgi:SAM-dependent methyltransferase